MRKIVIVVLAFALIVTACGSANTDTEAGAEQLCTLEPPRDVDFTTLDQIVELVQARSYFYEDEASLETAYFGAFTAVYAFVGLTRSDIPEDVQKEIMDRSRKGIVDFSILQEDFQRLAADSRYAQLGRADQQSDIFTAAANGVIKALGDPFGHYTPPENVFGRNQRSNGGFVGFGFQFERTDANEFKINSVHAGQPAALAGLSAGDIVLAIDGKSLEQCSQTSFSEALRGGMGETTTFSVRHLDGTLEDIPITRGDVMLTSVVSTPGITWGDGRGSSESDMPFKPPLRDREGNSVSGVLYIGYWNFTLPSIADLSNVIRSTPSEYYENGIILDLRGNPGGALRAAQMLLDYFTEGSIITHVERTREGYVVPQAFSSSYDLAIDVPLVVLIGPDTYDRAGASDNSYSAAEFVSGALQDYGRATIIGNRSGGKGLIGTTFPLKDDGELTLEVREFRTPDGNVIQGEDFNGDGIFDTGGIIPDIVVEWSDDDYNKRNRNPSWDPALYKAIDVLLGRK